jgi:hypothetical protein
LFKDHPEQDSILPLISTASVEAASNNKDKSSTKRWEEGVIVEVIAYSKRNSIDEAKNYEDDGDKCNPLDVHDDPVFDYSNPSSHSRNKNGLCRTIILSRPSGGTLTY